MNEKLETLIELDPEDHSMALVRYKCASCDAFHAMPVGPLDADLTCVKRSLMLVKMLRRADARDFSLLISLVSRNQGWLLTVQRNAAGYSPRIYLATTDVERDKESELDQVLAAAPPPAEWQRPDQDIDFPTAEGALAAGYRAIKASLAAHDPLASLWRD